MTLSLRGRVPLPEHVSGGFDHGGVLGATGRVFVAHTANDTVEVIDGERLALEQTLTGCPEGSGVMQAELQAKRQWVSSVRQLRLTSHSPDPIHGRRQPTRVVCRGSVRAMTTIGSCNLNLQCTARLSSPTRAVAGS